MIAAIAGSSLCGYSLEAECCSFLYIETGSRTNRCHVLGCRKQRIHKWNEYYCTVCYRSCCFYIIYWTPYIKAKSTNTIEGLLIEAEGSGRRVATLKQAVFYSVWFRIHARSNELAALLPNTL